MYGFLLLCLEWSLAQNTALLPGTYHLLLADTKSLTDQYLVTVHWIDALAPIGMSLVHLGAGSFFIYSISYAKHARTKTLLGASGLALYLPILLLLNSIPHGRLQLHSVASTDWILQAQGNGTSFMTSTGLSLRLSRDELLPSPVYLHRIEMPSLTHTQQTAQGWFFYVQTTRGQRAYLCGDVDTGRVTYEQSCARPWTLALLHS